MSREMKKARVIAIANQKGGVGKTTTVINLAHWFALHGRRVLVLDLDGQGHIAPGLRLPGGDHLYRFLVHEEEVSNVTVKARENLDIIPNDHTGELAKEHVKQANFREYILDTALEEARERYDLIFLDTPPGADVLHVLALVASDFLIVPANMDFYALNGVGQILKTVRNLKRYPGVTPPVLVGVLPTLFDKLTNETLNNLQSLQQSLGENYILPPIPRDTRLREASSHGQTIWEYAPACQGAAGYPGNGEKQCNSSGKVGGYLHIAEILHDIVR
jgi:chromosome partitioning protein